MFSDLHSFLILLWILIDCPLSVLNMNNCHGNAHGCCDGYFWDRNACVKCPTGYTDKNCSEKCRYPSYGEECQLECQCNETECDYITGCIDVSTVTNLDKTSMLNSKTDSSLHSSKKLQSPWSANKIISLCTLVIFSISIILCGVHLIVTLKKRISEQASNLQTEAYQNDAQYQEIPDNLILRNFTKENQDCTRVTQV
ncbi:multiple epidermal growth factor-like domains protein 10 [Saccostrea cucullata]|uniref:multiple epidermal growth factor-like domains protein 10 n=1 Tax=Saccostrea cuccullata TaxID=36930 RepID=UPI002ECFDF72